MNRLIQTIFIQFLKRRTKKQGLKPHPPTKKDVQVFRIHVRTQVLHGIFIITGMLSAGLGLKGFLLPNGFIDGGVTGISLLVSEHTGINLSLLIIIINVPFILMGLRLIDKVFVLKTLTAISGLAICIFLIPYPVVTSDKLLVAVFGGVFLGAGVGLAVRGGAVIDGTEILALGVTRRTSLSIGDVILIINVIIFTVAAWVLSFERALYSILTYVSAAKTVDFIISGIETDLPLYQRKANKFDV